jgi:hypothetical protein
VKRLDKIDRARADLKKIVRSIIRLKYSLMADDELNEVLPAAEIRFNANILKGELPDPIEIKRILNV